MKKMFLICLVIIYSIMPNLHVQVAAGSITESMDGALPGQKGRDAPSQPLTNLNIRMNLILMTG